MWFKGYEHFKRSANPRPSKKAFYTCQWLGNIDMHSYVKFDQNIPCGSVQLLFAFSLTGSGRTEGLW